MQTPGALEHISYRVVIGNNTQTVHPVLGTFPVKGCIPLPVANGGTMSTDNAGSTAGTVVKGSGTTWLSTLGIRPEKGDFLADSNGVCRRIKSVDSDTQITLDAKFPASVSGITVNLVKKNRFRQILAASTGSATAILQEQNFASGDRTLNDGTPLSYDVSTASSEISFTLSE